MAAADARKRIILAAERLIAERGQEVPLRDIAAAAGQRNNSAVQYHFGSRDGLIAAVVEMRLATLEARRLELLAEQAGSGTPPGVHGLLEALVVPMFELGERHGVHHYARFLTQIHTHPAVTDAANLDSAARTSVRVIMQGLDRELVDLPPRLRVRRLRAVTTMLFALLADFEHAVEAGKVRSGDVDAWGEIIDMLAGALTAPVADPAGVRVRGYR
ncbi:TetR family transcriptional regulator [Nocardia otitidiscaviarum]|uniref:TetR family transcriptional regulator n=1 Tax=Nocardia otitidiscaviarum TaxID=1823 RepID=A0A516NTJ6_9NOCA|nr:TetR family transcriptional regulator [Nocardia otitidiscaviarum]MCP9621562.1 TetR family transcriptional regulator [Nocardia otitidiscaviarum]QDP82230.1 TetR family transcriptional regulator [Nocardia otitidiscaviarum]